SPSTSKTRRSAGRRADDIAETFDVGDPNASCPVSLAAIRCSYVHPLTPAAVNAENLDRLVTCWTEPVREPGVELGDLARPQRDLVLPKDDPHPAREHVKPLIPRVRSQLSCPLGWDHDLPYRKATRVLGQREHEAAVAATRLESDARVAHLGRADELVER